MKKLFLLFLILSTGRLLGQNFDMDWRQCFGGNGLDEGNDIVKTPSGYLVLSVWNQQQIWLIKTDFEGNLVWEKKYGGSQHEYSYRIIEGSDQTYYIAATAVSSDGDITNDPYPNSADFWIFKIDSTGNMLWDRIYGGTGRDEVYNACLNPEGGVTLLGTTLSCDGDVDTCYGYYDFWILKLDDRGDKIWSRVIGSAFADEPHMIIATSDGGYLIGGDIYPEYSINGNLSCETGNDSWDGNLIKLNSNGGVEWQHCYGGSEIDVITSAIELEDGYLIGAYASAGDGDLLNSGYHLGWDHLGNQTYDSWLIKIDYFGNILWQKCYGGTHSDYTLKMFRTERGFRIFNISYSFDGDVTGNNSWNYSFSDIWTFEIDSTGNLLSNQCFGAKANEQMNYGVSKVSDYQYVVTGLTISTDWSCAYDYDIFLFQVTDTLIDATEDLALEEIVETFPMPASDYIDFKLKMPGLAEFKIYNNLGMKQDAFVTENDSYTLFVKNKPAGLYIYKLMLNGKIYCGKFIVVK